MPPITSSAASEFLPATKFAAAEIVLLHGWGSSREIWRPLLSHVRDWANITLVDIPGCSVAVDAPDNLDLDHALEDVLSHCPPRAMYVGWSLGGQLALEIARTRSERVMGVATICSNPRFVETRDWPGMSPEAFTQFTHSARQNLRAALKRFNALQCLGKQPARSVQRQLLSLSGENAPPSLQAGLGWLARLDMRDVIASLRVPQLHVLAEADSLVPRATGRALEKLLQNAEDFSDVRYLPDVSHVAPLEAPALVAQHVFQFLQASKNVLPCSSAVSADFEKEDVAASFSKAASSYDAAASLQRDVGVALLSRLEAPIRQVETVVDLGCGTGYFSSALHERYPKALHIGLDLAPGMVAYARENSSQRQHWAVADAESLPLASGSVDVIFSSLALQWCHRPDLLFAELGRVLRPGGRCVFATLGPETLKELRASWASVDERQHVNQFLPDRELAAVASARGQIELALETEFFVMRYERVKALLLELKALGAHNVNRNRASGLTGRAALRDMQQAYEQWRTDGLLPATYEVIFGVLEVA